jgi:hypothetical protein
MPRPHPCFGCGLPIQSQPHCCHHPASPGHAALRVGRAPLAVACGRPDNHSVFALCLPACRPSTIPPSRRIRIASCNRQRHFSSDLGLERRAILSRPVTASHWYDDLLSQPAPFSFRTHCCYLSRSFLICPWPPFSPGGACCNDGMADQAAGTR